MAKSKSSSKPEKAGPGVKEGRVTKPAQTPIAKSKELAKQTVSKIKLKDEKSKKGKKVKEPTPDPESESESDSGSEEESDDSGSSISDSDSDVSDSEMKDTGVGKAKTNGVTKAAADDSASEDDSEADDSEDEPTKATGLKANGVSVPKAAATKEESDSKGSSDGSSDAESEDDSAPPAKRTAGAQKDDDTSDESESSEDEAAPSKANGVKLNGVAKKDDASSSEEDEDEDGDSGSDISSSDESEEEEEAPSKKRKAEEPVTPAAKKSKGFESADATPATRNLFVGNLSWNVDEEWLAREFEGFGEIVGCRLITDRDSGRSKGYGYVEFADSETAAQAHAEKNGAMVDGRELRVDFSQGRTPRTNDNTPQRAERAQRFGDTVGKPADTLFCGNLSFDCTNDMLSEAFSEFGTITRVSLPRDRESDLPKGFGYVAFSTIDEAKAAFEAMQGTQLAGRPMRLDYAGPRPDNAGAGGGRGGGRGGRGGFGNRGGRGGFGDRGGRGGRGGARGGRGGSFGSTNRGGFGDFKGKKVTF